MSTNTFVSQKKALLVFKENIIQELQYYDKRIQEVGTKLKRKYNYDVYSSDSEDDFPLLANPLMNNSIQELVLQQSLMRIRLQASQELTNLQILQSEVNVLVEEPQFEREPTVSEPGIWREITSDCRVGLVPFSITFFAHTPHRKFAPKSYRGLRVVLVKSVHEKELASSVLHSLSEPSDAVEMLRNYAVAYRSRRTTLACLAKKYCNTLFMEAHAEGGFVLKCSNLLEVRWTLENKRSQVALFQHKMSFQLEYMDELYVNIISHSHKQLSNPSIQTDERTLIIDKIISTCLEAKGVDPQQSNESDMESKTTNNDLNKKDSEVMAPPKSLPKKVKAKNKENIRNIANTAQKRKRIDDGSSNVSKKMKTSDVVSDKNVIRESGNTVNLAALDKATINKDPNTETVNKVDKTKKSSATTKNSATATVKAIDETKNVKNKHVNADKNKSKRPQNPESKQKPENVDASNKNKINKENTKKSKETVQQNTVTKIKSNNNEEANVKNKTAKNNTKNVANIEDANKILEEILETVVNTKNKVDNEQKKVQNVKNATDTNEKKDADNNKKKTKATATKQVKSISKTNNNVKNHKGVESAVISQSKPKTKAKNATENLDRLNNKTKNAAGSNPQTAKAKNNNARPTENIAKTKKATSDKVTEKHANNKNKDKIVDRDTNTDSNKIKNIDTCKLNKIITDKQNNNANSSLTKSPLNAQNRFKVGHIEGIKNFEASTTESENNGRISKIPLKKSPFRENVIANQPRNSPRFIKKPTTKN